VDIKTVYDPFISDVLIMAEGLEAAGVPGRFLVETLHILKYLPKWMPGAGFKTWAERYKQAAIRLFHNPFDHIYNLHVSLSL